MKRVSPSVFAEKVFEQFSRYSVNKEEAKNVSEKYEVSIPVVISKQFTSKSKIVDLTVYITNTEKDEVVEKKPSTKDIVSKETDYIQYIPNKNANFVPYGTNFTLIKNVVKSNTFFPIYIWGVSGLGKTFMVEQACAMYKRPLFRVQVTRDTTNEDLIGSFSLINGNTVWVDGPVLMAYKSGGVLLLDEVDLNPSLMSLQVVLENKPVYVSQTGELIYPNEGFTVFATGNTKGDGGDSRFVGTSVLNDAFLERFVTIVEQTIPNIETESKMISKYCENEGIALDEKMKETLLLWIEKARKLYKEDNISAYISSRRVQYILKTYKVTGNFNKSVELVVARYNEEEAVALYNAFKSVAPSEETE